jgi:3',5'-nucleoside bisphosphate phosphatase
MLPLRLQAAILAGLGECMQFVDLHVHSTASDGMLKPGEIAARASGAGLAAIAVCDHDTVDGVREAVAAAAGTAMLQIPGVELSVSLVSGGSVHMLGYFPGTDPDVLCNPASPLGSALERVRQARDRRNPAILEKLAALGCRLEEQEVRDLAGGDVVGRPHIAQAMLARGYISTFREAFDRFLARGRPAYVERERILESEAISLVRDLGGIPVLAHPGLLGRNQYELDALISSMSDRGLRGVEVYYPRHSAEFTDWLCRTTASKGLLATGGTDFHGLEGDPAGLGGTPGVFSVTVGQVERFLEACASPAPGR